MIRKNFFFYIFTIFLFSTFNSFSQQLTNSFWEDIQESSIPKSFKRYIIPADYRTLTYNMENLRQILSSAPSEHNVRNNNYVPLEISIPRPDGRTERFAIMSTPIMEADLASRYPEIQTYGGQGLDDLTATIKLDITPAGFHAMVLSPNGTYFIDPYFLNKDKYYISYTKKAFYENAEKNSHTLHCELEKEGEIEKEIKRLVNNGVEYSGNQLRTYRLALAATGEYTSFHGGSVTLGLAAIVTAMNRVNGVYEKEVAIRMILVANNDLIVYTNSSTDPYSNNNGSTMLGQNQTNLDNIIGSANYDIGHVFSTGGGGIAGLGVVCRNGSKARGVTGAPQPIGDPFTIDYVAHEMGHQYGGNHSFNGSAGNCSGGNRNASTAYEPGSGSTIMAYAGICSPQDLQMNSDAYFHGVNLDELIAYSTGTYGNSCPVITNTGNTPPVVTAGTGGFVIPISTPFALTGSATDADNDALTYCWEQFDLGAAGAPNSPSGNAPIFRSFNPVTSPTRTFPKLSNLLNNTQTIGEILPSYARTLTFRLTARDNKNGGGGIGKSQLSFTVTSSAGPFLVTAPNTAVNWTGNTAQTISWNVANTNTTPVNVSNVKILLSTDGGNSWGIVLAENTPNDGSEEVLIPNVPTINARVKVESIGNIFFDISNVNFSIADNPIPVELVSFKAEANESVVTLVWETATETNNSGFAIERRSETGDFSRVAFIEGAGTTSEKNYYTYTDNIPVQGKSYYRLKQIDFDGSYMLSNVIEVETNQLTKFNLYANYPNPFNPETVINYEIPQDGIVSLKVYDILGNEIATLVEENQKGGKHSVSFNTSSYNLSSGVYIYKLQADKFTSVKKMILSK